MKLECNKCGASVKFDPNNITTNCPYCDSALQMDAKSLKEILAITEEHKTQRARIDADIELEAMRIKERQQKADRIKKNILLGIAIYFGVLLFLVLLNIVLLKVLPL